MAKRSLVHDSKALKKSTKKKATKRPKPKDNPQIADIENTIKNREIKKEGIINTGDFERGVVSTGSTLLDLAISANRTYGGGIPAGVIVEVFGPSSSGKTAILAEIGASVKAKGGVVMYDDPEARLDTAYAAKCGLTLEPEEYNRPETVDELERALFDWVPRPPKKNAICARCEDSLAAFSTLAEIEDDHKMAAAKRAQKFHELFRKLARHIKHEGWVVACANQEQESFGGGGAKTTPGGNAVKYYSSIRMRVAPDYKGGKIKKTWKMGKSVVEKIVGIKSIARIIKNSCDDPFREVPFYILFGQGIDDIRGNLQWLKDTLGSKTYDCIDREFGMMGPAIRYIEQYELELVLRDKVVTLYNHIEDHFRTQRKPKVRF